MRAVGRRLSCMLLEVIDRDAVEAFGKGAIVGEDGELEHGAVWHEAGGWALRSEEHTSELQSLMRISYAVLCLKKKRKKITSTNKDENTYNTKEKYTGNRTTYT